MGRNRKADRELKKILNAIEKNSLDMAERMAYTNKKLDDIDKMERSSTSKHSTLIGIIQILIAIISMLNLPITYYKPENVVFEPEGQIFLYPEYSVFSQGMAVDMTASLDFEADAVSITAHLASGGEDTVELKRKNEAEWQNRVVFDEVGVHEIVVSATAPNGEVIENSVEVEVTPISIDMDDINQLFNL